MSRRLALFCISTLLPLLAQTPFGRITGRIVDSTNAVVRGAKISAVRIETNVVSSTESNAEGSFDLLNLIPGKYHLTVEVPGFKRYERGPLEVRLGDVLNIPIPLEVGVQAESVTITAEAPLLESASASVNQVVNTRQLNDMPTPSGAVTYQLLTMPGVITTIPVGQIWGMEARNQHNSFVVAGTPAGSSSLFLDGVPNSKVQEANAPSFVPPAEAVQELRVETAPFDASIGKFTGAYINMVLKSGTNNLHGNLMFRHNSTPLMSKPYFVNRSYYDLSSGAPTREKERRLWPYTRDNRYSASVGGPVIIPHLYNGRNRTFWQFTFDLGDRIWASTANQTVPTFKERGGDFSELLALGSTYQVYDPATITPAASGRFSRLPFAGNIIPRSRLDPMALKMIEYYALPNAGGTVDGRQNWQGAGPAWLHMNQQIVRVDQAIGNNHHIFASVTLNTQNQEQNDIFHNQGSGNHYYPWAHRGLALDDALTLRPDLVLNLRYGLTRFKRRTTPTSFGAVDLTALGLSPNLVSQLDPTRAALPYTQVDQFPTLGGALNDRTGELSHLFLGNMTYIRGVHSIRFGGELRLQQDNWNEFNTSYAPVYNFTAAWTRGPLDTSPAAPIGQGLASLLLGLPASGYIDRLAGRSARGKFMAGYLQDDWKISRKLTLNLGVRYEFETPVTEIYDRANRGFDFNTPNPISAAAKANYAAAPIPEVPVAAFRTMGGLLFANTQGTPGGMWDSNPKNFAPRVGMAYLLRRDTVIRAGYAIYYKMLGLGDETSVYQQGLSQRTQLESSVDNGVTFRANMQNPFPDGLLPPLGSSAGLKTFLGNGISFFSPNRRNGYMQRWSFSMQHEFAHRILLEIGYTGNRGTALGVQNDINAVPSQYLSTSPFRDQATIDRLATVVTSPFYGIPEFASTNYSGRTVARSVLLRPYPQFGAINVTSDQGFSWYHDAHFRVEKRFSHGYTMQVSYTWSKFMDATSKLNASDPGPEHVISSLDRPHRVVLSGIYELPFGKGKTWLNAVPGWLNQITGGWSVQGIYTGQSGPPIEFPNIAFYGDVHSIVLPKDQRTVERWFNTAGGFERDPQKQLASNLRKFPSRLTGVRADGENNFDLSVFKNFRLREKWNFQLRGEGMNALNHAHFAAPTSNPSNTLFGQVTNTTYSRQRVISVGARMQW
jgi:hypothetical protein